MIFDANKKMTDCSPTQPQVIIERQHHEKNHCQSRESQLQQSLLPSRPQEKKAPTFFEDLFGFAEDHKRQMLWLTLRMFRGNEVMMVLQWLMEGDVQANGTPPNKI